eukprot:scaffold2859_cov349-Pavlova_lutheri.AAC.63
MEGAHPPSAPLVNLHVNTSPTPPPYAPGDPPRHAPLRVPFSQCSFRRSSRSDAVTDGDPVKLWVKSIRPR